MARDTLEEIEEEEEKKKTNTTTTITTIEPLAKSLPSICKPIETKLNILKA